MVNIIVFFSGDECNAKEQMSFLSGWGKGLEYYPIPSCGGRAEGRSAFGRTISGGGGGGWDVCEVRAGW